MQQQSKLLGFCIFICFCFAFFTFNILMVGHVWLPLLNITPVESFSMGGEHDKQTGSSWIGAKVPRMGRSKPGLPESVTQASTTS